MISLKELLNIEINESKITKEKALSAFMKSFDPDQLPSEEKFQEYVTIDGNESTGFVINYNGWYCPRKGAKTLVSPYYTLGDIDLVWLYKCNNMASLEGAPKKVREFIIEGCSKITSLEGLEHSDIEELNLRELPKLSSFKGCPKKLQEFSYRPHRFQPSMRNLEGLPKRIEGEFYVCGAFQTKSLEGMPEEIGGDFSCDVYDFNKGSLPKRIEGDAWIQFWGRDLDPTQYGLEYIGGDFKTNRFDAFANSDVKIGGRLIKG